MTLTTYISDNFPTIKSQLGWSDSVQIAVIVDKAVELYGAASESVATDLAKLHVLADVAVWRQALNDISLDYAFSADGASFHRNQAVDAIRKNLAEAYTNAMVYMSGYDIVVHTQDDHPDWTE
jgi:hypothetical protein